MSKKPKKTAPKKEEIKQLDLGIKEPFKNKICKIKGKTEIMLLQIEVKKFLMDSFFWLVTVITTIMLGQQLLLLSQSYKKLPSFMPVLNYNLEADTRLTSKEFIFIFPVMTLICLIMSIVTTAKYYNREKMLSKFILLGTLLVGISSSILLLYLSKDY